MLLPQIDSLKIAFEVILKLELFKTVKNINEKSYKT
jgi:hypothetical protein